MIKVKTLNLGDFLQKQRVEEIDTLITDLQGYDLTVLKTLDYYIKNKLIRTMKCEVEWDGKPPCYLNLPSNKLKDFLEYLNGYYKKNDPEKGTEDWWETDFNFEKI